VLRPDLEDLDETKSFAYGEYKEHPLCKNRNPRWKLFAFKQIADVSNIFLTSHVQSAWHELDEEMGWRARCMVINPQKGRINFFFFSGVSAVRLVV